MKPIVDLLWWAWTTLEQGGQALWRFPWHYLIDIGIVAFIIYQTYIRFRGTRAMRILSGIVILGLGYLVAKAAGLFLTSWLLGGVWAAALIFVIVIFQGEIRQILEQVNPKLPIMTQLHRAGQVQLPEERLGIIAKTAFALASKPCGALLVFERHNFLDPLLRSGGVVIDAQISPELLETLFAPLAPLHDGALYIRKGRAYRAGCVLPLSGNQQLASFYGTRHRAALGISEQSDALVVVVSEERGEISVVEDSRIATVHTPTELLNWIAERTGANGEAPSQQRSLKALGTHNWRPKLAALVAAGLLWFVLVGQQDTEKVFSVPVVYDNVPENLMIDRDRVRQVYVHVQGSREMLNFLSPDQLQVTLDLSEANSGWQHYPISVKEINLPPGLQLVRVTPPAVRFRLRQRPLEGHLLP